ncbi:MAG: type II secretion system F family protein [Bacillota bacterium]
MSLYVYRAVDVSGKQYSGTLEADNITSAVKLLKIQGYYVTSIKQRQGCFFSQLFFIKKVKSLDLARFNKQISVLLNSGMPLLNALEVVQSHTQHSTLKSTLGLVKESVKRGNPLYKSLEKHPDVYSTLMVKMVQAGEIGGSLDITLQRMAEHYEREHEMHEKLVSALIYPILVLIMSFVSLLIIIFLVAPTFEGYIYYFSQDLPLLTKLFFYVTNMVHKLWYMLIILPIIIIVGLIKISHTTAGQKNLDKAKLFLPILGDLVKGAITARFCFALSTLLSCGVPLLQSLDTVKEITGNWVYIQEVDMMNKAIIEGKSLSEPIKNSAVFDNMFKQMVKVGEETGKLDSLLFTLGEFYQKEVDIKTVRLVSMVEPAMIIFVGCIVAIMVFAIFIPMISLLNAF